MNGEDTVLHVVIPGICPPAPRPRARVIPMGKKRIATLYTPTKGPYATWKRIAKGFIMGARGRTRAFPILSDPIEVRLLFVMPLPESQHRKTMHIVRSWCRSHRRGDVDNLAKGPLDAANGILWTDDRDVVSCQAEKIVGEQGEPPRVEMLVWRNRDAHAHQTEFERVRESLLKSGRLIETSTQEVASWQPQVQTMSLPL